MTLKTLNLFVEFVKQSIKEGAKQRKTVLKYMARRTNKK